MKHILKDAIKFSNENSVLFKFNSRSKYASYSIGIYCSLLELAQSFYLIINENHFTGSLSIYRTFIENYVDLKNLVKNLDYVHQLDYDSHFQNIRKFKSAQKGNLYLKSLSEYAADKIPELEKKMKETKRFPGIQIVKTIREKFIMAGMETEYLGLYPVLCSEAHSSLSAITARHFEIGEDTDCVKIVVNSTNTSEHYDFYICNIADQLIHSGELISTLLERQNIEKYIDKRKELRSETELHNQNYKGFETK